MKKLLSLVALLTILSACQPRANQSASEGAVVDLDAKEFADFIAKNADAQIVDVRTAGEFEGGHITHALNIDWSAEGFEDKIKNLNPKNPVMVYCLSGARSAEAAHALRAKGFEKVYDLSRGMLAWRANNLPEEHAGATSPSMSLAEYQAAVNTDKLVLVDFYADWCAPCKQMEPYLNKISTELKDKVTLLRIDVDKHVELSQALKIEALPVLKLYKGDKLIWDNLGFVDEASVRKVLAAH
jgi:thioredoxin